MELTGAGLSMTARGLQEDTEEELCDALALLLVDHIQTSSDERDLFREIIECAKSAVLALVTVLEENKRMPFQVLCNVMEFYKAENGCPDELKRWPLCEVLAFF
ncbi:hypothetical protein BC936DRAFT_138253 [Jimgerdemannia flammicorona]|uniref:Uncharacterized protein n=1 Tax=Jimgerdemannia flammicorona TaxID=994334 RepID=A0A433CVS6_9FUNG|nr:hypothetical protein BC936DRAFT_138253 [Jimgerdemannia flammicorona]